MTALRRVTALDPLIYLHSIYAALIPTCIIFPSLCPPVSVTLTMIWLAVLLMETGFSFQLEYSYASLLSSNSLVQSSEILVFFNYRNNCHPV